MISQALLDSVACPVCLEPGGCALCARPGGDHRACGEYRDRVRCRCGGPDKPRLSARDGALVCPCCGVAYRMRAEEGRLELLPVDGLGDQTRYADPEFQERLHLGEGPPLLSARVKSDLMREMLAAEPGERLLDLGCGGGRLAAYATRDAVHVTGIDVAASFGHEAARKVDLVLGDLRRLPFRKGSFSGAYCLDVLEHLDEEGVREVLTEARRALSASGRLLVYTHAMESSRLASFQRGVNRLARRLGRLGLLDQERERLRKSDHLNPFSSHEHFAALCAEVGFEVVARRYYNVVFKAVVEDLLLRIYEQWRRRSSKAPARQAQSDRADDDGWRRPGRFGLGVALVLTWLLKLDVVLFGGIRTGPFFGLLRPNAARGEQP